MFDFRAEAKSQFSRVASKYGLAIERVDDSEILLLRDGLAISIAYDREGIEVSYIDGVEGNLRAYRLTNFLGTQRFNEDDRAHYGSPVTGVDRIMASMRVFASGLEHRCEDILTGDKAWLMAFKRKDPVSWQGRPVSRLVERAIGKGASIPPSDEVGGA